MILRTIFSSEHEDFRASVRRFYQDEIMPFHEQWEQQQMVDRGIWRRAGELGMLCMTMPEEYGGAGADRLYSVVMFEEQQRAGASGIGFFLHSDIVANYLNDFGTAAQKREWLPRMATGELIAAIAMSEPATGSDLQNIQTRAADGGDCYIVNGAKTFITNGFLCDFALVAVKTGSADEDRGAHSLSLLLIPADLPGFSKSKPLKKAGMKAQDTQTDARYSASQFPLIRALGSSLRKCTRRSGSVACSWTNASSSSCGARSRRKRRPWPSTGAPSC